MKNILFYASFLTILFFTACNTSKMETPKNNDAFIKSELIIQLQSKVQPSAIEAAFEQYELVKKDMVSRHSNLWLFTYDTQLIDPDKMILLIKDSELTIEASFNKKLTQRDGSN